MFAVRCSRRSLLTGHSVPRSLTETLPLLASRVGRVSRWSRLAAPGHRPGARLRAWSKEVRPASRHCARDEERRPGDRPEEGLRMSERRSREQKAEHRSRLGRVVARCGAVAVRERLAFGLSLNTVTDSVSTLSRTQSQHCHGLSLNTVTDSVSENSTPRNITVGWGGLWRSAGRCGQD